MEAQLMTVVEALEDVARRHPRRPAIWYEDRTISFAELDAQSRRVATGLMRRGIDAGDRVALWLPSSPAWLVAFFALARLGAIAVATNTRFRSHEIRDLLGRAGAKAIMFWPGYRGIDFGSVLGEVLPDLAGLEFLIEYQEGTAGTEPVGRVPVVTYAALAEAPPLSTSRARPDSRCLILTTSGTTSRMKLVTHRQSSIVGHAFDLATGMGYGAPRARVINLLPLSGTFGFSQAMGTIFAGKPMVLHHTFDAPLAARLMRERRVTLAAVTEEMVRRIYEAVAEPVPFPGLRLFTGSRASELVDLSLARGFTMIGLYGSSECHAMFARRNDTDDPQTRTLGGGYPVTPTARVRAVDPETGAVLPHEEPGELQFRTPWVMAEYFGDPETTARAFTADGFFRTGDLGFTCADGSFRYLSRMGDVLRLRGFLVNPMEIESCVRGFPGVDKCQVVGAEHGGRTVAVAFYTLQPDARVDNAALHAYCAAGMAPHKVPVRYVEVEAFPVIESPNAIKVNRALLRERAAELLAGSSPAT